MNEIKQTSQQALSDEVLRKIGSNLLLFQQLEELLKLLLGTSPVQGMRGDLMARQAQRMEVAHKKMAGLFAKQYINEILTKDGASSQEMESPFLPWISLCFKITGDSEFCESQRRILKLVVDERNELVHHFLPRWRPESLDQLADTCAYLDMQRERITPMFERLLSMVKTKHNHANPSAAAEGDRFLELLWLQDSPLINQLRDIASQFCRADGWTHLAHAGRLARIREPADAANMKEIYGYSTFKKLLIACELFEVFDERLPAGGSRTLYRLR